LTYQKNLNGSAKCKGEKQNAKGQKNKMWWAFFKPQTT
jgi:hypothetical protein